MNCKECGCEFIPESHKHKRCADCRERANIAPAGRYCDCGNVATVKVLGRKEYECDRCHRLAQAYSARTQKTCGHGEDYVRHWPSIGGFAYIN
jgi:hypothetical protein